MHIKTQYSVISTLKCVYCGKVDMLFLAAVGPQAWVPLLLGVLQEGPAAWDPGRHLASQAEEGAGVRVGALAGVPHLAVLAEVHLWWVDTLHKISSKRYHHHAHNAM